MKKLLVAFAALALSTSLASAEQFKSFGDFLSQITGGPSKSAPESTGPAASKSFNGFADFASKITGGKGAPAEKTGGDNRNADGSYRGGSQR